MSQTELTFKGLDETECMSFIREVHRRAHEAGHLRDNAWMADIAMVAFDGGALKWFDEQAPEVQADWALLRRALIQKYSDNQFEPVPPAAIMIPTRMATPAAVSVAVPSLNTSPATFQSSQRLYPYRRSETPVFNIKVIAPKVLYIGYVSRVFDDSEFGGRCCTLTEDKAVAFGCLEPIASGEELHLLQAHTTVNTNVPESTLKLFRTRDNWLSTVLTLTTQIIGSGQITIREDGQPLEHYWNFLSGFWTWNELTGRLTHSYGPHIMLGKNRQGDPTLFFWNHRVWDDEDDVFAAELYLVRAN